MNKRAIITLIICLLLLDVNYAFAIPDVEYFEWVHGSFKIPTKIQKIKTIIDLKPFLEDEYYFTG